MFEPVNTESYASPLLVGCPEDLPDEDEKTWHDHTASQPVEAVPQEVRVQLRVLTGPEQGRCITLTPGRSVIGRSPEADITLDHHSISRRHCAVEVHPDHTVEIVDLGSTNGTHVATRRLQGSPVAAEDGTRIRLSSQVVLELGIESAATALLFQHLYEKAVRDPLTGLYNKRVFLERFEAELSQSRRSGRPMTTLIIDIDHFKRINDTYGHDAGDSVLKAVGAVLQRAVRTEDLAARFGGEEFVLILRDTAPALGLQVGERLRQLISALQVDHHGERIRVTASAGLACSSELGVGVAMDIFNRADQRLYQAKAGGRNRLVGPQAA